MENMVLRYAKSYVTHFYTATCFTIELRYIISKNIKRSKTNAEETAKPKPKKKPEDS